LETRKGEGDRKRKEKAKKNKGNGNSVEGTKNGRRISMMLA